MSILMSALRIVLGSVAGFAILCAAFYVGRRHPAFVVSPLLFMLAGYYLFFMLRARRTGVVILYDKMWHRHFIERRRNPNWFMFYVVLSGFVSLISSGSAVFYLVYSFLHR
jgi:hypothetical protein